MLGWHQKKGEMIYGVEIFNILNTNSTRFARNFQRAKRKSQCVLILNLNPSSQANFVILIIWTSRNQTSIDFFSRSQLIIDECGSSSFNNKIPKNVTPTPLHSFFQKLDIN
jgi:hypothetical protein